MAALRQIRIFGKGGIESTTSQNTLAALPKWLEDPDRRLRSKSFTQPV